MSNEQSNISGIGQEVPSHRARVIQINPLSTESVPVLIRPPETVTMRSGSIVLLPSQNVGRHTTGNNEEVLVVFSGSGEMRLGDGTILNLRPYVILYCPPDTEHDVFNTGSEPLRYVYLVAQAR
jgi:mannose-6-phosphate isomerase-like protein (cupin superfamily)